MKKIYYFFAAAMICLTAASCTQELNDGSLDGNLESSTEGTIPDNYIELTFTSPNMDVKTSVEGNTVSWSQGDKIRICWNGGSIISKEVAIEDGTAYFTAMVAPEATEFYAVYPASIEAEVTEDKFNITIPASQSGRFADADIIVAKTTLDELSYAFHHTVSLVKFVVSTENEKGISRASFVDLANESQLIGTMAITFDDNNGIAERTVTEDLTLDVIDVTAVQPGENYMAVIPGKQLAGFGLRLGSASKWYTGLVGENPQTLGERLNLGEVDTKIHEGDYYIKADGTGKGTSWADAGGPERLQSLIGDYDSGDKKNLAIAWRIDGKKILVAEGVYKSVGGVNGFSSRYIGDHTITFTIEGGYAIDGSKSDTALTIFGSSTEKEIDAYRAFFICGNVSATLTDLQITHHDRTGSAGGGAIYCAKGAQLILKNCNISHNKTSNARAGGAILSEGNLEIINCIFSDNKAATSGGAIYMDKSAPLTISNTTFANNSSETGNGGALCTTGPAYANKCKFLGNFANKKNQSGVIGLSGNSSAYFNSCEFRDNYVNNVTNGGPIIYTSATTCSLGFNNCFLIDNNSQKTSFFVCTSSSCIMANTTFIDNSLEATNASLLYMLGNGSVHTCVNNIIINKNESYYGFRNSGTNTLTTCYNIYSKPMGLTSGTGDLPETYLLPNEEKIISNDAGMSYYSWSGSVDGFLPTSKTNVANTIKSNAKFGQDFYNWLDELVDGPGTALDYDIRGVARTATVWPGSYQN